MFYGKRAALRLNKRRMSLQRQHKSLLDDLAKRSGQPQAAEFAERIESIRLALRQATIETIDICRTLSTRMDALNLGGVAEATIANGQLSIVCNDVAKTLAKLDKDAAR